jgi:hypothetical protein
MQTMNTETAGRRLFAAGTMRGGGAPGTECPGCLPWGKCEVCGKDADDPCDWRRYNGGTWQRAAAMLIADVEALAPAFRFFLPAAVHELRSALIRDAARTVSPGDGPDTAPHVRGSDTSRAAAQAVAPALRGKRRVVLIQCMYSDPSLSVSGYTDNELTRLMSLGNGWGSNSCRPRRIELTRAGWLEDSGERRNGSTVWRPTAKAWAWWREQQNGGGR